MNKRVLIIKSNDDSFEQYYSKKILEAGIEVQSPYRTVTNGVSKFIRNAFIKLNFSNLIKPWLESWNNSLDDYETVIVFDKGVTDIVIKWIKSHYPRTRLIYWLWNIPTHSIEMYQKYSDRICCFDSEFSRKKEIAYVPQFFFPPEEMKTVVNHSHTVLFVGADKGRIPILKKLAEILPQFGYQCNFKVLCSNSIPLQKGIEYISNPIAYPELLRMVAQSDILLEIVKANQTGLTVRMIEALFFEKKVITNNIQIQTYDFYHPDNIFILQDKNDINYTELESFLKKAYRSVDEAVKAKYLFSNWISNVIRS